MQLVNGRRRVHVDGDGSLVYRAHVVPTFSLRLQALQSSEDDRPTDLRQAVVLGYLGGAASPQKLPRAPYRLADLSRDQVLALPLPSGNIYQVTIERMALE